MITTAKQLALLLLLALVLRLGAAWWWQSRLNESFVFGDSQSYWVLGQAIAQGRPYEHYSPEVRVFRTPGYPLMLAGIFCTVGSDASVLWGRAVSAVCGVLAVGGVWWLAKELFGANAGLLAAAIAALYPGAIATSILVLSEAPFCPLMLAQSILWIAAWKAPTPKRAGLLALAAGAVAGMATLVRPSWLLFTPFALFVALVFSPSAAKRRHLGLGTAMILGLVVAMLPWWIRNARVTGHFVPTTLQVGASLYDGWNPQANGSSNMDFVPAFVEAERREPAAAGGQKSDTLEYRLDQRMRAAAVAWARSHPAEALRLAGIKFTRMWNLWPNEPSLSSWPIRLAVAATYGPVMLLAVFGAWKTIHLGWPYVLCWLPAVYFSLLHVVFVSSIRYRQPPMLALIVLAAGVVVWRGNAKLEKEVVSGQ